MKAAVGFLLLLCGFLAVLALADASFAPSSIRRRPIVHRTTTVHRHLHHEEKEKGFFDDQLLSKRVYNFTQVPGSPGLDVGTH